MIGATFCSIILLPL